VPQNNPSQGVRRPPFRLRPLAARLAWLALASALLSPGAHADDALGDLLRAVGARPHARATFVEHQQLKLLRRPLESSGELLFAPPDRLEKRTLAPRPESLLVEAGQLTLQRGKRHMSVALASYPQIEPLVEGIRATLAGDRATLERLFVVAFSSRAEAWSLSLQPRDAQLARMVSELRIDGQGGDVLRVETLRADGDRSVMDITPQDPK
jgi:hypothetical protein